MSLQALNLIKDGLKTYAPLVDYLQTRYNTPGKHLIGYETGSSSSKNRPCFFYVAANGKYAPKAISLKRHGVIIFQTIEKETTDECQDGVTATDYVADRVIDYLQSQPVPDVLLADFEIATDFYMQHPYYEIGVKFSFLQDRQRSL